MAKIDEIKKQNPRFNKSLIDVLKMIVPGNENKYTETLLKLIKTNPRRTHSDYINDLRVELTRRFGVPEFQVSEMDNHEMVLTWTLLDLYIAPDDSRAFIKFCELNERKLIDNPDVTSYSSFKQIEEANAIAEIKLLDKISEKQIHKIYEDSEWISLRPLTYNASLKYGASTKWCTAMQNDQAYYNKYGSRGILIYNINRKTGLKVACYKSLIADEPEFSFWDVKDVRIDSMESGLPDNIIQAIRNEINTNTKSNYDLGVELGIYGAVKVMPEVEELLRARLVARNDERFNALQGAINNVGRDEEVEPDEVANPEPYFTVANPNGILTGITGPNGTTTGTITINPYTWTMPMNTATFLTNTDANGEIRHYVEPSDIVYGQSLHDGIMRQLAELEERANSIEERANVLNEPTDSLNMQGLIRESQAADPSLIERAADVARRAFGSNRNRYDDVF